MVLVDLDLGDLKSEDRLNGYIGNKKKMRGYLQLWCNACKHGIYISQALIPENAKMVEIRDKSIDFNILIPDYIRVVPE